MLFEGMKIFILMSPDIDFDVTTLGVRYRIVAVCCSVLQCVAVCCACILLARDIDFDVNTLGVRDRVAAVCCSVGVLQCVALCCSVLQCVAV